MRSFISDSKTATANPTDASSIPQKENIIYVPQGCVARLTKASLHTAITGLYTNEFSTCNILVWVTPDKISLAHLDKAIKQSALSNLLAEQMKWTGEKQEVMIITRKEGKALTDKVTAAIALQSGLKPTLKEVGDEVGGILIDFAADAKSNAIPNVKFLSQAEKPQNLLHHSDEQKLVTLSKVKFFLSAITKKALADGIVIYDEIGCEQISDAALRLPPEVNELAEWKNKSHDEIAKEINEELGEVEKEMLSDIVFYVENYLHAYNRDAIFVKNITALLNTSVQPKPTDQDNKYKEHISKALTSSDSVFDKIQEIIKDYRATPSSAYKDYLLTRIEEFSGHYRRRAAYSQMANLRQVKIKRMEELKDLAVKEYKKESYKSAIPLFLEYLQLCTHLYVKSDPRLSTIYFNLGKSYFRVNQYESARIFLKHALLLQENYLKDKTSIEKYKSALVECEDKSLTAAQQSKSPQASSSVIMNALTQVPAQILFAIVDLKFTEKGEIKILEFGRGVGSGFKGYNNLHAEPMTKLLEKKLSVLTQLPVYYNEEIFPKLSLLSGMELPKEISKISEYKAIYGGKFYNFHLPQILMIDNMPTWVLVARHKAVMNQLFYEAKREDYRPRCQLHPVQYITELAGKIQKEIPAKKYVIKAPRACRGRGVFVVNSNELDITLKLLLKGKTQIERNEVEREYQKLLSNKKSPDYIEEDIQHATEWRNQIAGDKEFIVEEYCESKLIKYKNKSYDATMRVAFLILMNEGKPSFTPLGCYWKLPQMPINEGHLRDYSISHMGAETASQKIDKQDEEKIFSALKPVMTDVFNKMQSFYLPDIIRQKENNRSPSLESLYLFLSYMQVLVEMSRYTEALKLFAEMREKIEKVKDEDPKYYIQCYHQEGLAHLYSGENQKAIDSCTRALAHVLKYSLKNSGCYLIRAIAFQEKNDEKNYIINYKKACENKFPGFSELEKDIRNTLEKNKKIQLIKEQVQQKSATLKTSSATPSASATDQKSLQTPAQKKDREESPSPKPSASTSARLTF